MKQNELIHNYQKLTGFNYLSSMLDKISSNTKEQNVATFHHLIWMIPVGGYLQNPVMKELYTSVVDGLAEIYGINMEKIADAKEAIDIDANGVVDTNEEEIKVVADTVKKAKTTKRSKAKIEVAE